MNIVELWAGLTGGPLKRILESVQRIEANQRVIAREFEGRFADVDDALKSVRDQLDRIESDIGGGNEASSLVITVGTPTEQE